MHGGNWRGLGLGLQDGGRLSFETLWGFRMPTVQQSLIYSVDQRGGIYGYRSVLFYVPRVDTTKRSK